MNVSYYSEDELLDLVDEHDRVIDQKLRSYVYAQNLSNFRAINAFLINDKKELWIPCRSAHKKLFPLCLDASVGGHVMAGETYQEAFERELFEELNIVASSITYQEVAKLTPHEHNVAAFMYVYIIMTNNAPAYNTQDFVGGSWISIAVLQKQINAGQKVKSDLPKIINFLQKNFFSIYSE